MISQFFRRNSSFSSKIIKKLDLSFKNTSLQRFLNKSHASNYIQRKIYTHPISYNFSKVSKLVNPFNKEPVSDKSYIEDDKIVEKVNKVTEQQKQWKKLALQQRIELVQKFVDSVLADQQSLTKVIASSIGKCVKDIRQEFTELRDEVPLLLGQGIDALNIQTINESDEGIVKIVPEPIGVTMIFPHYSEPIFDSMIHLIPCLVSGCGALIKSSDFNHFLGQYLEKKVKQTTGFELIADMFIEPEDLCKLSQFRSFKKVIYSGSHTSAKHIFEILTEKRFIDCNMYFGGQDAIYVDENANIDQAINEIMKAAFANNGQTYDSVKRLYIKESLYEKMLQILRERISQIKLGDPTDQQTDQGPLGIPEAATALEEMINEAITMGAKCQIGGTITNVESGVGIYFEPTLLTQLTNDMSILHTHSPAPILCCFCVTNDQDFLTNFNDNRFGAKVKILTGPGSPKEIYARYENLINNLEVGSIIVNKGSICTSNRRLESWKASTNNRKSSSRSYEQFTIPKVFDI